MKNFLLFALLFVTTITNAQTYSVVDGGKIQITLNQVLADGTEIITKTPPLDSAVASNRLFESLVQTNQEIASLRVQLDEMEAQAARLQKSYRDLSVQDPKVRIADLYGKELVGKYQLSDTTSVVEAEIIINDAGRLILRMNKTNYPIDTKSNDFFIVSKLKPFDIEFVRRRQDVWVFAERGRKIILQKQ